MIRKPIHVWRAMTNLVARLEVAHGDLLRIVAVLRDTGAAVVYSGAVPPGQTAYSLIGWINHFRDERAEILTLRGTSAAAILDRVFPELVDQAQAYVQDIGTVNTAGTVLRYMQLAFAAHATSEPLTNGERAQLANAIEALLEA